MLAVILFLRLVGPVQEGPRPSFRAQVIDSSISIGYGIAIGDVDGDKKQDILLADKKQIVWYRNGDWKKFVMAEDLTEFDNVCIAARDINGDGMVEVAVGAQWNPSETSNDSLSGSVHYLVRPADLNHKWKPIHLHHEPTIHRMRWARTSKGKYYLIVLPLHGRGNKAGEGAGVKVMAYEVPSDVHSAWPVKTLSEEMHLTHNLDIKEERGGNTKIYVAGKEGVRLIEEPFEGKIKSVAVAMPGKVHAAGEVRISKDFLATIQPMHGNQLAIYPANRQMERVIIDSSFNEGHALGVADFSGTGYDQVVAGWRNPNKEQMVGVKLYSKSDPQGTEWQSQWIDRNGMACEDLQIADLNGDGKPDIVASGRSTRNLKIYWNE